MMLDILANNNWERPIYFTGGSYEESEYIWMKDYLQLDGLVYKLVPIKTSIENNPYEMGRIDSDLMYDIVKKWSWGNSESDEIYHDPETRKNSISFRSNLSRLSEELISEGEYEKAEEILDLAFSKMPIDYYGYYSLWTPLVKSYYDIGKSEKVKEIVQKLSFKYSDRLSYFSSLEIFNQYDVGEEIISDIERFRNLIETIQESGEREILTDQIKSFISSSEQFNYIYGEYDYYISLSLSEGLPNSVLESLSFCKPAILSSIESHREIKSDFSKMVTVVKNKNADKIIKEIVSATKKKYPKKILIMGIIK